MNLCRAQNFITEGPPPKDFRTLRELCGGAALESVLIVTIDWDLPPEVLDSLWSLRVEAMLNQGSEAELSQGLEVKLSQGFEAMLQYGARSYHCDGTSESAQDALKVLLTDRQGVLKIQRELIDNLDQEAFELVETDSIKDIRNPEESTKNAIKRVEVLQRELEEQKIQAQEEADAFRKTIDKMRCEGERMRQEMLQRCQEQEEQRRRAQEETDHLRKRIAEMGSKSGEDRGESGESPATHNCPPRSSSLHSRVFFMIPTVHAANLQQIYLSTDLRLTLATDSITRFMGGNTNNVCKS